MALFGVKLPVLSAAPHDGASSAWRIMREKGALCRGGHCCDKQVLIMILHALRALDSCSFHLCCSVLNFEASTYELRGYGPLSRGTKAFEAAAGEDRAGGG